MIERRVYLLSIAHSIYYNYLAVNTASLAKRNQTTSTYSHTL